MVDRVGPPCQRNSKNCLFFLNHAWKVICYWGQINIIWTLSTALASNSKQCTPPKVALGPAWRHCSPHWKAIGQWFCCQLICTYVSLWPQCSPVSAATLPRVCVKDNPALQRWACKENTLKLESDCEAFFSAADEGFGLKIVISEKCD